MSMIVKKEEIKKKIVLMGKLENKKIKNWKMIMRVKKKR